jgi:hypothetical protein
MEEDDVVLFRARVKFDYDAEDDTELTIGQGEIISVYKTSDNGWWFAEADDSACGWVPSNFLERLEEGADVQDVLEEAEPVLMNPVESVPAEIVFTEAEVVDPEPVVQPKVEERTVNAAPSPAPAAAASPAQAAKAKKDPLPHLAKAKAGEEGCGQCARVLSGGYVMAGGAKFHEECFTCIVCNDSLLNSGFIEKDGGLYCEKDFHYTFSPKCAHCKEPITDQYITALGRSYHPDHFVCKVCSQPFPDGMFHQYAEEPYCEQHFQELFAVKCGDCGKPILGRGFTVDEIEKTFHEECFVCHDATKHRIKDGEDFHVHDGKVYCHTHFKDLVLAKCGKCKKVIEADYLTVKNSNYHVDCFKCEDCGNSILDGKFSIFKDQLLCHGCTKRAKSVTPAAPAAKAAPAAPPAPAASAAKSRENAAAKRAEPTMKYGSVESRKANEEKVEVVEKKEEPTAPAAAGAPAASNVSATEYAGPFFSYDQLKAKTVDSQIDRTRREMYISADQFQSVFGMSKAAFYAAPAWRQKKLKQEKGLF